MILRFFDTASVDGFKKRGVGGRGRGGGPGSGAGWGLGARAGLGVAQPPPLANKSCKPGDAMMLLCYGKCGRTVKRRGGLRAQPPQQG